MRGLIDKKLIRDYLRGHATRKLNLGCGRNPLAGWLNADRRPKAWRIVRLDVTQEFPFEADLFSHVHSEHLIEHLTYAQGAQMLSECYRVLGRGGKIRVSTPDLSFLLALHDDDRSEVQEQYIDWATRTHVKEAPYPAASFVINNFLRDWGHQFIYDERVLRGTLEAAGFRQIATCPLGHSADSEFRDLENTSRMPAGFLALESLILEAVKA